MINFQNFGVDDNENYLSYLKKCPQIPSDASPLNLLNLQRKYNVRRGYAENFCWHKFILEGEEFFAFPVGDWDNADWKKIFAENIPAGTVFQFVPENLLEIWQKVFGDDIEFESDRDFWDYILDMEKMSKLSGKDLKSFRNDKNYFEKNYQHEVEEITPKIFDELLAFQIKAEKNLLERAGHEEFAENDDKNFKFALENWDKFNLSGFVVRADKKIVSYSIEEIIDEKTIISPIAKADYNFRGANQFTYWYEAKINLERGFLEENICDDVGEENLRFFKERLQPKAMLKKFIVTYK